MPDGPYPAVAAAPADPYGLLPGVERFSLHELERARQLVATLTIVGRPCVYIYRAEDGLPLYVGQTSCLTSRMHGHRRAPWFPAADLLDVLPTFTADKRAIERDLIRLLKPVHNIAP